VDGISVLGFSMQAPIMRKVGGGKLKFDEYRISKNLIQKFRFSKPVSISSFNVDSGCD
jgi:hypothetical protein